MEHAFENSKQLWKSAKMRHFSLGMLRKNLLQFHALLIILKYASGEKW